MPFADTVFNNPQGGLSPSDSVLNDSSKSSEVNHGIPEDGGGYSAQTVDQTGDGPPKPEPVEREEEKRKVLHVAPLGITVFFVNKAMLPDGFMAGSFAKYSYIPKGEVWISSDVPKEKAKICSQKFR